MWRSWRSPNQHRSLISEILLYHERQFRGNGGSLDIATIALIGSGTISHVASTLRMEREKGERKGSLAAQGVNRQGPGR